MDWITELQLFFGGPNGKLAVTILGVGGSLLGAGYWIGHKLGRNKRTLALKQNVSLQKQLEHAQETNRQQLQHSQHLKTELEDCRLKYQQVSRKYDQAIEKLHPYYKEYVRIRPKYDQLKIDLKIERDLVAQLTSDRGEADRAVIALREDIEAQQKKLEQIERRTRRALGLRGNLWAAKALQARPRFRPLAERTCPIVSVLNLKGGVGKTTVTSQLGIALAKKGYRVLLVDLDFQGSLTQLFLPRDQHRALAHNRHLIHHFLDLASSDKTTKLLEYVQPSGLGELSQPGRLEIIAASDDLAYTELNLTLQWLLRRGSRDNRFLLRKALHMKSVSRSYDLILLDCPPIINISCINALAASDYLLIPVTLSRSVTERVPILLKRFLRNPRFVQHINTHLRVLGLVANRTFRESLAGGEQNDWDQLAVWCRDAFGQDIHRFKTVIQQLNREIRDNEALLTEQRLDSKLSRLFADLATEIEKELPHESRRGAAALS